MNKPTDTVRRCGHCAACCTVFRIADAGTERMQRCQHERAGPRCCRVFGTDQHPIDCVQFECMWLSGALPQSKRPDKCGCVLTASTRGGRPSINVFESRTGAAHSLVEFIRRARRDGCAVNVIPPPIGGVEVTRTHLPPYRNALAAWRADR